MSLIEIEARYRVVTPLFCGGASPGVNGAKAELRLPSFKGVLRYWWRALAWSEYGGSLADIQAAENELFGSGGGGARRSRVVMRLTKVSSHIGLAKGQFLNDDRGQPVSPGAHHGLSYLGYGLIETRTRELSRACLIPRRNEPFEFEVHLRCRRVDAQPLELLRRALKVIGTLGGFGARSRRGYGSLVLTGLKEDGVYRWQPPKSIAELKQRIDQLTSSARNPGTPEYTAFSNGSRHVLLEAMDIRESLALLDRVGREMLRFRSFGREGTVLATRGGSGVRAEQNYRSDHDSMQLLAARGTAPTTHPERIAFGLPHNYFFSNNPPRRKKAGVRPAGQLDRRASPLFIHLNLCGASPVAVLSFLPAVFLPSAPHTTAMIRVGSHDVPLATTPTLYRPIHDFLDRLAGNSNRERFTGVEVCP